MIFTEPIWNMLHKIRVVMGKRDSRYKLTEFIEIDGIATVKYLPLQV